MAEATNGIATTLAPKSVKQPQWRPGTHDFFFKDSTKRERIFIADDNKLGGLASFEMHDTGSWRNDVKWIDIDSWYYLSGDTLVTLFTSGAGDATIQININQYFLPKGAANFSFIKVGDTERYSDKSWRPKQIPIGAFTSANNLFLARKGQIEQITSDADKNIINGQAVHRNEFGIDNGIFFSPKGNYLAYYRMDQTMVADYPVIDWSVTPAKNENVKYPMAGGTSHQVTVQVYNIATKQTTAIKTEGPKDQYLTCVTWSPDEKYIYIAILNRDQNHLWLNNGF